MKKPATKRQQRKTRKAIPKRQIKNQAIKLTNKPKPPGRAVETIDKVLTLRQRRRMERAVAALDAAGDTSPNLRDYRFYELPSKTGWEPLWPWTIDGRLIFVCGNPGKLYDWWAALHPGDREHFRLLSRQAGMRPTAADRRDAKKTALALKFR